MFWGELSLQGLLELGIEERIMTKLTVETIPTRNWKQKLDKHELKLYHQFYAFRNCIVHKDSILNKDQIKTVQAVMYDDPSIVFFFHNLQFHVLQFQL